MKLHLQKVILVIIIRDNFDHLNSETNKAIEQLVKEILPDDDFKTKAKKAFQIFFDLDVLAILLPVLYVCVRYSIIEYKESNTITECADGIVASIFVLLCYLSVHIITLRTSKIICYFLSKKFTEPRVCSLRIRTRV